MGDVTLGVQLSEQGARAVALETAGGGWRLRWRARLEEAAGRASLADRVSEELAAAEVRPDTAAVALPASPGSVYQTLELPPLRGRDLSSVAGSELRREVGEDAVRGLEVRAWQFGGGGANTLAAGVPSDVLEGALTFGETLGVPVRVVTVPPMALHHGLLGLDGLDDGGATGLTWVGERFGFVAYVRGARWILIHHFPVPPDEVGAEGVVRETKQSFTFLRSRAPDESLTRMVLAGPGLPDENLPARLAPELAGAEVETFSFPGELGLEGMAHGTEFLRRQGDYAVALLLAARPDGFPLDFLPASAKLPRLRRRFLRGAAAAAGVGLLATALHAGLAWSSLSEAGDRLDRLEGGMSSLGPRLEEVRRERTRERSDRAALHLAGLAEQQAVLGPAALRRLSRAVGDGITVDSLAWSADGDGWRLRIDGRTTGPSASRASRRVSELLSGLRASPVFLRVSAEEQEIGRLSGGAFQVRFGIEATLMEGTGGGG